MDRRIKLCVVSPMYHPSLGGLGRQAQLLTERLFHDGLKVFVIARRMKGVPQAVFNPGIKVYRAWSIKPYLHNFEEVKLVNVLISLTFSMSCAILLFWKRKDYDIVHFHGASLPLFLNLLILKILGKKVIAKVAAARIGTEAGALRGRYFGLSRLILIFLKKVDAFIATTAEIEDGLRHDGFDGKKIKRIPNFIDFNIFSPVPESKKTLMKNNMRFENIRVVTFSGRFVRRKGIKILLEAWKTVMDKFTDAQLILLGDGPLLPKMKRTTEDLGMNSLVNFRGHVHSVTDFLHITDIFVLPSLQEGMPNSLLEAMACGLPVIASRIGGVVDVIEDGKNGILFEPGDVSGLAYAMIRLLNDNELRKTLGVEARKRIEEGFSIDRISGEYIGLYREII